MKPKISVWGAKTWKTAGKCTHLLRDGNKFCVLGAASFALFGTVRGLRKYWHGSESKIDQLVDYNNLRGTTKAQVLAYARRLGL